MIKKLTSFIFLFTLLILIAGENIAQKKKKKSSQPEVTSMMADSVFSGLKLRNIGPAIMSGRIADIDIHPNNDNIWYVAVGSGGVWKTSNAGVTWTPVFDKEDSYSIGCITVDPSNPHTIWVGTGENVGGRHVGFGNGVYRSDDDGVSWKNLGLKETQHISEIIVHPENSDKIWVAAQGPLWSKGGERGLYLSEDGGKTWKKTLGDEEWTGVTDLIIDPRNPDRLYAATWQRHRNVASYMGGGPGSGIHRSLDGGETWEKLTNGLPTSNMGKIGLAISPQKPDVIYADIELDRRKGGLYKSTNMGSSWALQSETVSGGTGPHYYQELYASPHHFDRIYLANVRFLVSDNGGKTFSQLNELKKHSDNHSLAFKAGDPDYLLAGTDGGIYESFDQAENWRFIPNLPVTQFYKVAVDDAEPFYNIYGGTQDNNTQGGPSRTDKPYGSSNADWYLTLFADGHQPATEPGNPDIIYSEWQQGNLTRVDRTTSEIVYIKPQPEPGDEPERFNWDAPILISPHKVTRLYFASQRVWRSEDRGDSWTSISGDLTRNQERMALPIMGKQQSWDEPWDVSAMSNYNTITSLSESPALEGLVYAGTDDGIIQVTENGGEAWRKIEVSNLPGVPSTAFVNDIKADLYDPNIVYVALDNHKYGDLKPYLYKSIDKGQSWQSMASNLPEKTLVWRIVQDHVKPSLFFLATEFGIYFTVDSGSKWVKLKGGVPTISFRDLAIQKRENDLVGASFGRGFFVFDDYSVLREVSNEQLKQEATLFPVRKAWWYMPQPVNAVGSYGASYYVAPNPPFGAVFTYYLKDDLKKLVDSRKEEEKSLRESNADIEFPGWEALEEERKQEDPVMILTVKDDKGEVIRNIYGPAKKGFQRVSWDLRYPSPRVISSIGAEISFFESGSGMMVAPGKYTVMLSKKADGVVTSLSEAIEFSVERMRTGALQGADPDVVAGFWKSIDDILRDYSATTAALGKAMNKTVAMQEALSKAKTEPGDLDRQLYKLRMDLMDIQEQLGGNESKDEVGEIGPATIQSRISVATMGTSFSTYGPTPTHLRSLEIALEQYNAIKTKLDQLVDGVIPDLENKLKLAGAPKIE